MFRFRLSQLIVIIIASTVMLSCSNNKGRGINTGANYGVYPDANCLLSPAGYQGHCNYDYSGGGVSPFFTNYQFTLGVNGLNNNYATGFCGCGQGAYPVYNNNWGLGCVNNQYLQSVGYGGYGGYSNYTQYLMYSWNPSALQWVTAQQNNSYYYGGGYYASCQNLFTVILACDTGVQGSCGPTAACLSLGNTGGSGYSQSGPGLCVMNRTGYY